MFTLISVMKHSERLNNATCTNEVAGFTGRYWYCLCFLLLIPNVIRPVLLPHIRFNRDVMLAKDNTPVKRLEAHTLYCNKQTPTTPIACTNYGLKSEQARVGHIEAQCACTAAANKSQGAHACYSSDVPFYNSLFTDTLYHGKQCTLL
mgnify:CR=1 FL=1